MAPVTGKSSGRSSDNAAADATTKHEHPLQAVLLADSFDAAVSSAFSMIVPSNSNNNNNNRRCCRPKMLCPLNNVVLLDYALDYLAGQCGVQEVIVVCTQDQVKAHVEQQQQQQQHQQQRRRNEQPAESETLSTTAASSGAAGANATGVNNRTMTVTVLLDKSLTNAGDALRELDRRDWVQSDPFLLLYGDILTNIDLTAAIQQHKIRHKKDRSAIMTCVFQTVGATTTTTSVPSYATTLNSAVALRKSPLRPVMDDLILAIDPAQDNRILMYDDTASAKTVALPCSFFASHSGMTILTGLLDCGLDICSPDVLARFTDEFDYRDIRRKFVTNSVAEEEEGLQNKIFAHLAAPHEYAARVHDFATYHAISQDLLQRWCYPVVPDNLPAASASAAAGHESQYRYKQTQQRHFWYQETKHGKARIGRTSVVTGPGMMGASTFVGEHCVVNRTVLGHHCHIADGVHITDSHLWDSVEVETGCRIQHAILGDGAVIKAGAVVSRGCIIGAGCVVGKNVILPEFTRLTTTKECNEEVDDDWNDEEEDEEDEGDDDDDEENNDNNDEDDEDEDNGLGNKEEEQDQPGAVVTPTTVSKHVMLSTVVKPVDSGDMIETDHDVVGPDGVGRVWKPSMDEEYVEGCEDWYGLTVEEVTKAQSLGFNPLQLYLNRFQHQQEGPDGFSDDDEDDGQDRTGGALQGTGLDAYEDSVTFGVTPGESATVTNIIGRQKGVDVIKELKTICLEYEHNAPIENLAIELNSFKFSQNATYSDCTMAATLAIVEQMNITRNTKDSKLLTEFKSALNHWAPLLQKMSIGIDEERAIVLALERSATDPTANPNGAEVVQVLSTGLSFRLLLQTLHDEEIVSEEAIFAWAEDRRTDAETDPNTLRAKLFQLAPVQEFLEWLEEEEESEQGDGSESGSD